MKQKHNEQLHMEEYSIEINEHFTNEQQLVYEVETGIFQQYSRIYFLNH